MRHFDLRVVWSLMMILLVGCQGPGTASTRPADTQSAPVDFRAVINHAKEKVFPAVVYIKVVQETFEGGKKVSREISGSGVIISATGEVLTNHHVIDKAVEVRCLLFDGQALDAKVIGSDKDTDLALLQLQLVAGTSVPFAVIGDSTKLREGDFVMAMGAPWGLSRSVSLGIVSCSRRYLPAISEYSLWLQTDAAISPGNSGGPLVNTDGQVIGINSRGMMQGGDMGFAVPTETIGPLVTQLRRSGKVEWTWTGLQLQPLKDFNRNTYFEGTAGVIVADTDPESPARRAGILPKDRIMKLGGQALTALMEEDLPVIRRRLGMLAKDAAVQLEIVRGTQTLTVPLTPREKGKVEGDSLDCPRWDLTIRTINQFDNPDLYFQRNTGVFVYGVKYPGNASTAGLQGEDILLKIDGQAVTTLEDVKKIHTQSLAGIKDKQRLMVTVLRNGLLRQVVLDISRDFSKE
ncbi:MAG: trypsin-like peptidase domain-containing protein [Phycisphaerae bacterium]